MRQWYKWLHISKTFMNYERGLGGMKTVSRRIRKDQDDRLIALGKMQAGGGNINGMVQEAVEHWLAVNEPIQEATYAEIKRQLMRK
jgi:hypothetical protein